MNKLFLIIIAILSLVGAPVWAAQTTSFGPTTVLGNATITGPSAAISYTVVQLTGCQTVANSTTCNVTDSVTAGATLIFGVQQCADSSCVSAASGTVSVTDSTHSISSVCPSGALNVGDIFLVQACYILSATGGSTNFVVTFTNAAGWYPTMAVYQKTGTASVSEDTAVANTSAPGAVANQSVVTATSVAQANEFIFACSAGVAPVSNQNDAGNYNGGQSDCGWVKGPASGTQTMSWADSSTGSPKVQSLIGLEH